MTTGERIRQRRLELGMTQKELAEKLGYSTKTTVAAIEAGRNELRQAKIQAIAEVLDCDPLWLIGLSNEAPEPKPGWYLDPEAAEIADFLHKNPSYKVLFDTARKVKPEDLRTVQKMLDALTDDD